MYRNICIITMAMTYSPTGLPNIEDEQLVDLKSLSIQGDETPKTDTGSSDISRKRIAALGVLLQESQKPQTPELKKEIQDAIEDTLTNPQVVQEVVQGLTKPDPANEEQMKEFIMDAYKKAKDINYGYRNGSEKVELANSQVDTILQSLDSADTEQLNLEYEKAKEVLESAMKSMEAQKLIADYLRFRVRAYKQDAELANGVKIRQNDTGVFDPKEIKLNISSALGILEGNPSKLIRLTLSPGKPKRS